MPAGDDEFRDVALGLQCNLGTIQQGHYYGGMHVERQSRRRAALAQRLVGQRVTQKTDAGSAESLGDAQLQETLLAQPVVILGGMRRVAVMCAGSSGEIRRQLLTALPQLPVFVAERKIQGSSLLSIIKQPLKPASRHGRDGSRCVPRLGGGLQARKRHMEMPHGSHDT